MTKSLDGQSTLCDLAVSMRGIVFLLLREQADPCKTYLAVRAQSLGIQFSEHLIYETRGLCSLKFKVMMILCFDSFIHDVFDFI